MTPTPRRRLGRLLALLPFAFARRAAAETPPPAGLVPRADDPGVPPGRMLLTIFLRHDEHKTLAEINQHLAATGWFEKFPPEGVDIVAWYVMMGIGQVVVLSLPPEKLRAVNLVVESAAWGGFTTEFYPTYDYRAAWEAMKRAAHRQ
jgi:hypothetical protein